MTQKAPEDGIFVVFSEDWYTLVQSVHRDLGSALAAAREWEKVEFLRWGNDLDNLEPIEDQPGN